jgi:hypothetical protein
MHEYILKPGHRPCVGETGELTGIARAASSLKSTIITCIVIFSISLGR